VSDTLFMGSKHYVICSYHAGTHFRCLIFVLHRHLGKVWALFPSARDENLLAMSMVVLGPLVLLTGPNK